MQHLLMTKRVLRLMLDTGASETFLTITAGSGWDGDRFESVDVEDAQGNRLEAFGGGSLRALMRDGNGDWRSELVADKAYESASFRRNLLATRSLIARDWTVVLRTSDHHLLSPSGTKYPIVEKDGHLFVDLILQPSTGATVAPATTLDPVEASTLRSVAYAAAADIAGPGVPVAPARPRQPQINPNGRRARQRHVGADDLGGFGHHGGECLTCGDRTQLPPTHLAPLPTNDLPSPPPLDTGLGVTHDGTQQEAEREIKAAQARAVLETRYSNWVYYHSAFNHRDDVVEQLLKQGILKDVTKPPNFRCESCELAKVRNPHFGTSREMPRDPKTLAPWAEVECDIFGPIDCGDRNGYRWLMAFICIAVGTVFVVPMQTKSGAVEALKGFTAHVASTSRTIESTLKYPTGHIKVHLLRSDRDGAFTTTNGATQSLFDEWAKSHVSSRFFATPGEPRSGTTSIERFWGTIKDATDALMIESKKGEEFKFDAMSCAWSVYNRSPTAANIIGHGAAPYATLGLQASLDNIVPFNSLCTVKFAPNQKGVCANRFGRIIGYPVDTPGYRVHLDPPDDAVPGAAPEIIAVGATPRRNGQAWGLRDDGSFSRVHSAPAPTVATPTYVPLPIYALARATDEIESPILQIPAVQPVGAAPGDAGSRHALLPHPKARTPRLPGGPPVCTTDVARNKIANAINQGWDLCYAQENPKIGASAARYDIYKVATTFADLATFRQSQMTIAGKTMRVLKGGDLALKGDVLHDVRHGFLTFVAPISAPSAPNAQSPAIDQHTDVPTTVEPGTANAPRRTAPYSKRMHYVSNAPLPVEATDVVDDYSTDPPQHGMQEPSVWASRLRRKRFLASAAVRQEDLTDAERETLRVGLESRSAYVACPAVIITAAVAQTERAALPTAQRAPRSLKEAMSSPDKDLWIEAIKKEIGGLREKDVWEEVLRASMPPTVTVARSELLFNIKKDGTHKVRFVVRGDLTTQGIHYLEGKSSMATVEAVRMLVSFAAGEHTSLRSLDFTQAFTNAPEINTKLYIDLPQLPAELVGTTYGNAKGSQRVAHMKRNLYGTIPGGRVWSQYLMRWMIETLGARCYMSDRNAFEWSWTSSSGVVDTLRGVIHVDDMLFTGSSPAVLDEFTRRVGAAFQITGGMEEATEFCGLQISRNWVKKTITLHQRDYAIMLAKKYDLGRLSKTEAAPYLIGAPSKLMPYDGETMEREQFDYSMFIGDLTWYSRTNPALAWRAHDLARYMQNPGPEHIKAAQHVLRYIYGHMDAGLTYHGSDEVLLQSYDHRHKLIMAYDADFDHAGSKACSGVVVLMNGAAVAWKVRKQTTVSNTTAEAEVKSCSVGAELVMAMADLHGEFMGKGHGTIRSMGDSQGALAQIGYGLDNKVCASYKRSQAFCEDAVSHGLIWLDHVPGPVNPADVLTKAVANISEFTYKADVINGNGPSLYESVAVIKILSETE
jgi:hypothetical protein